MDLHDVVVGGGEHGFGEAFPGFRDPGHFGTGGILDPEIQMLPVKRKMTKVPLLLNRGFDLVASPNSMARIA